MGVKVSKPIYQKMPVGRDLMRYLSVSFVILILTIAPLKRVMSQVLWQHTDYGMTVDQVKQVVPQAVAPSGKPDSIVMGNHGHAYELLRASGVQIASEPFTAKFYFYANKLQQVTLAIDDRKTFYDAKLTFDSVVTALTSKYGSPIKSANQTGILNMAETDWLAGRTNIVAVVLAVGDKPDATLNINYQVRLAQDADHL